MTALGDFIGGRFRAPEGAPLSSVDPARDGAVVLETAWSEARMAAACDVAAEAAPAWARLRREQRWAHLLRFREALSARAAELADALVRETGKLRSEARAEVGALLSRFDMVRAQVESDLAEGTIAGHPGEELRFHPLGVVGVIGPYNYPLHLCHAHAVPALLTGNAVVVKPSEVAPLCAQTYAQAAEDAGLPAGVLSVVQGRGASGAALAAHPAVRGLCFTGSYAVGKILTERVAERPELLLALEMGGKNTVVVLEDADLPQAAHEIVVGGYLTTGQRCTATDRVLVHESRAAELTDALRQMVGSLRFGDPEAPGSFAGPLTTASGRERFEAALAAARAAGAEAVLEGGRADGGFFALPSVHLLGARHEVPGYTDVEVFGPDVGIETFSDDDEAIAVLRASRFGLANSIFTFSDERFERFYRETQSGILNRNRSTNQASPRLPFGGLGQSGNYRPAGAHAARNTVAAVAVQTNVIGRVQVHPQLVAHMPPPDLDRMAAQHEREEAAEAARNVLDEPRPMRTELPRGGVLPKSSEWLTRLYAAERVVREKKPPVFDHLRSAGPYLVSVDDEPLSVLDGMSQTATLCGGFGENEVVRAYTEGAFAGTLASTADPSVVDHPAAEAFATVLRQRVPGLPQVSFVNSGAEANEKALALARAAIGDASRTKVLAFEGSFHGRTLLALSATWNPSKRTPYEIAGHEAVFAPYPLWERPGDDEPAAPSGFYAAAGHGDIADLTTRFGDADEDPLLAAEVAALAAVDDALRGGEIFACIVEPMQSEGGDRYATQRFYRALRLLTRAHQVPLIFDEVQTGFGLGGAFAWHSGFHLVNVRGQPDYPDAVTFAKRAQVGVCMSVWEDPEPTSVQPASLVRGRLHAEMVSTSHHAERIQKLVAPRLEVLAQGFPHLVENPRVRGYAFAFDLPTADHLKAYLGQRFWRGAIVFGAGSRTVRYRLSEGYLAREVDELFASVRRSLAWLDAHPGSQPPAWEDLPAASAPRRVEPEVRIRGLAGDEATAFLPAILDIEYRVYEPARRTPPAEIRAALEDPDGTVHVAEVRDGDGWHLVGFAIGHPLEAAAEHEEGPDRDPMLGRDNTLYSMSLTVAPAHHGLGIGRRLKEAQIRDAAARRRADRAPRYRYVTGRNRVGHTAAMTHLNRAYGAHLVCVLTGQYEDPEGQAIYYRIPLPPWAPEPGTADAPAVVDLAQGIARPLAEPPASLARAEASGLLYGPAVNKLTLMNYATPAAVRALEWIGALAPTLPHMYLTSSRDECVDKTLRLLRTHRSGAQVAIGLVGGYVGHTSAAARSISDPSVHRQGPAQYAWPRVPHPADVGAAASIAILRDVIDDAGGPDRVLGLFVEPVQERTGRIPPADYWDMLAALRRELEVPLVAVETASGCYRSGLGAFASSGLPVDPDVLIWWGGAHTGYLHVRGALRVATPLTLVSTWDGDELSLVREHHQLRAARRLDLEAGARALDEALAPASAAGMHHGGLGLYRVLEAKARGDELAAALCERGLRLRSLPGGRLAIAPPLDAAVPAAEALGRALKEVL